MAKPAWLGGYVILIDATKISEKKIFGSPLWEQIENFLPNYENEYVPVTGVYALTIAKPECNVDELITKINKILEDNMEEVS